MYISELAEPQLLVIYPGRFQPFHKGHHAVYEWLVGKFGRNNVYIATSNKVEGDRSPFSFAEKSYFMQLTGIPADRIIQATQPYQIDNVISSGNLTVSDPKNTVAIFAVSEKDMADDPRFSFRPKKDGSAPYFQPLTDIKQTQDLTQHGYIMTVPTFQFDVAGDPMQSASELRAEYRLADDQKRQAIIRDLFGRYTKEAEQIMNSRIGQSQAVTEEAAGVGVVKNSRDPRYVTATMGNQNDVTGNTLGQMMRAYHLVGKKAGKKKPRSVHLEQREPYQQAIDRLMMRRIEDIHNQIQEIQGRISKENLPPEYIAKLKEKVQKLKDEWKGYLSVR